MQNRRWFFREAAVSAGTVAVAACEGRPLESFVAAVPTPDPNPAWAWSGKVRGLRDPGERVTLRDAMTQELQSRGFWLIEKPGSQFRSNPAGVYVLDIRSIYEDAIRPSSTLWMFATRQFAGEQIVDTPIGAAIDLVNVSNGMTWGAMPLDAFVRAYGSSMLAIGDTSLRPHEETKQLKSPPADHFLCAA